MWLHGDILPYCQHNLSEKANPGCLSRRGFVKLESRYSSDAPGNLQQFELVHAIFSCH